MPGPYSFPTDRVTGGPSPAADVNALGAALNEADDAATPNVLVLRDGNGRFQAEDPSANDDVANKGWVTTQTGLLIPKSVINAKGDLIVGTGDDAYARLAVGADGTMPYADSTQAAGIRWDAAPSGGGGGTVVDHYPHVVGQYYTTTVDLDGQPNQDANVFGTSGQRIFLTPLAITHSQTLDRLAQSIAGLGGAGSLLWLGLYPHSSSFGTVSRAAHASTAADSAGDKYLTVSAAVTPGMYWLAIGTTDTTGNLRVFRASGRTGSPTPFGTGSPGVDSEFAMRFDGVSLASGMPATLNLSTFSAKVRTDVPLVWIRKA